MSRRSLIFISAIWGCVTAIGLAQATPRDAIETRSGPVTGYVEEGVSVFRGIPYARPPEGELRWRPPQPVIPWKGIRSCVQPGPNCPQSDSLFLQSTLRRSEDCLYLNVWSRRVGIKQRAPVIVFIHGGGFFAGSANETGYSGLELAKRGAIVVNFNYRLGPFGFFAHPALSAESATKSSGNYGMLDQVAALRWVRANIAAFGGDPDCITVMGQSAGGVSVAALMASPLTAGLFHRAIVHSGAAPRQLRHLDAPSAGMESAHDKGRLFAAQLGVPAKSKEPLKALRALSVDALVEATSWLKRRPMESIHEHLIVDGNFLRESPSQSFHNGRQATVPLLIGSTADEGTLFTWLSPVKKMADLDRLLVQLFGEHRDAAREFYGIKDEASAGAAVIRIIGDQFVHFARQMVRDHSRRMGKDARVWLFQFDRVAPYLAKSGLESHHGVELPYVFGSFDARLTNGGYVQVDRELSQSLMTYWIQFARSGNPNGDKQTAWPAYDEKSDRHLAIGAHIVAGHALCKPACDFLDRSSR